MPSSTKCMKPQDVIYTQQPTCSFIYSPSDTSQTTKPGIIYNKRIPKHTTRMESIAYKPLSNHMSNNNRRFESRHLKLIFTLIALFIIFIISQQIIAQQQPIIVNFDNLNSPPQVSSSNREQHSIDLGHIHYHDHIDGPQVEITINDDLIYDTFVANEPIWWTTYIRYKYIVLGNYVRATKSFNFNSTVTLTTQATLEFMYHTTELCSRWEGPISVAVYAPGDELKSVMTMIKYLRDCHPSLASCIKQKVTWHIVYDINHGPGISQVNFPSYYVDKNILKQQNCQPTNQKIVSKKEAENKTIQMAELLKSNYRKSNQLPYPINVLRNTARLSAKTKYILSSDIELYPSVNIVSSFMKLLRKSSRSPYAVPEVTAHKRHIFTLPLFEVKENIQAPKTKPELLELMSQEKAIFFHKYVCDQCQEFPRRLEWIETKDTDKDQELGIFEVAQRNNSRRSWEPIYIGTNDDPLYDDRLTWEGREDKMGQMYEMCLQGYYLLVLDNAFMVHAPGIKHIDRKDNMRRFKYIKENNMIYNTRKSDLKKQYQDNRAEISTC